MPSLDEVRTFFVKEFPQCHVTVEDVARGRARVRHVIGPEQLRPGRTVSGPVMMATADAAAYAAILATIGIVPLAVTTSLNMTFMLKPRPDRDVLGEAELLKVGKRLVVADVRLFSDGAKDLVAHATVTYAVPPR